MPNKLRRRSFIAGGASAAALLPGAAATLFAGSRAPVHDLPVPVDELATPALLVDVDAMERNLAKMAAHGKANAVGIRPHGKTHKCPEIAKRQLKHGAIGVCAAKVGEAEAFAEAGIGQILITSPVATRDKVARIAKLASSIERLEVVVDHERSADLLAAAASAAGTTIRVLVGLDTGTRRTGIQPGTPAMQLVEHIEKLSPLDFRGFQAYAGHVMHIEGYEQRSAASKQSLAACHETWNLAKKAGHRAEIFSGGGTGTFDIDCDPKVMTDLQVGSYLFMDEQYRKIGSRESDTFQPFESSLFVLTTAISQPISEAITVDAGGKAIAPEPSAPARFRDLEGLLYHYAGDEHGIVQFLTDSRPLALGERALLAVSHCDPTVNLYDTLHVMQGDEVVELWPITGRGRSQ